MDRFYAALHIHEPDDTFVAGPFASVEAAQREIDSHPHCDHETRVVRMLLDPDKLIHFALEMLSSLGPFTRESIGIIITNWRIR